MATAQDTRIDQLAERVERLEADVQMLRAEQQMTAHQATSSASDQSNPAAHLWADMGMLRQEMQQLFKQLGIEGRTPIGALELQRRMAQAGLEPNEFSRSIIEMRDE